MDIKEFKHLFNSSLPIIGMVHLPPLPGSPRYNQSLGEIIDKAVHDAQAIENGGFDGLIVENYGDVPFYPDRVGPETVAAMTCIVHEIRRRIKKPIGINILRNDSMAAIAIATILKCDFIRVNVHIGTMATDQGIVTGKAFDTLRYRTSLASQVKIFADIFVKHGSVLGRQEIGQASQDVVLRGLADTVIVTGRSTGEFINIDELKEVKKAIPEVPVLAGSGVNEKNIIDIIKLVDGMIVGTWIKEDNKTENQVDEDKVRNLVELKKSITGKDE
jgi:membrane complex biogenesis BtpA family protein